MSKPLRARLPAPVRDRLRRGAHRATAALRFGFELAGLRVARRNDFDSPLPSEFELRRNEARWNRPSALAGVAYDLDAFRALLSRLAARYREEFQRLPAYEEVLAQGFGLGYTALDAFTLYAMIRDRKPRRYLEVGSGVSTYYCHLAAERNRAEGRPLEIRCIEPRPFEALAALPGIELDPKEVQDVPLAAFESLEAGDVLFLDSSHVLRIDGDVPYLHLEVLPRLARGVLVHVHDIPFPYNVPHPAERWTFGSVWPRFWNEAMVLQAFLCFNRSFEIVLSTPLLRHFDEAFLRASAPGYQPVGENPNTFSSIWLERVA